MQIRFLAARHGRNHTCQSGSHGSAGGGGAASSRSGGGSGELLDEGLDPGAQSANRHLAAHHRSETIFQNQRGIEMFYLQEPFRGLLQSLLGNQADDLA